MQTRRLTMLAILLTVSVVLNIVERTTMAALTQPFVAFLGPVVGAGGIRIGLANVVILLILYTYGTKDAFALLLFRIMIVGQLAIGLFSVPFFTSLIGGLISFTLMMIFKKFKGFTMISVSIVGAVGHVLGQITVAFVLFGYPILFYLPAMILVSIPAGIFTGKLAERLLVNLKPALESPNKM